MKVINLDQFRNYQTVQLGGVQYNVRGVNIEEYLEDTITKRLEGAKSERESLLVMIEILTDLTDIPRETLIKQDFNVIKAILQVAQGVDPTEEQQEGEEGKNG